ncbi:MAG: L,D-transpeptidase family protein [Deltaproteobacteria bacterium]|nr:MAG: L,D-transpeptidase family protein [Deltaproteobacteria bacterium]
MAESVRAGSLYEQVAESLQSRFSPSAEEHMTVCRGDLLCSSAVLPRFYAHRDFQPAWINDQGLLPQSMSLIEAIHGAYQEGLRPEDYHLANIEALIDEAVKGVTGYDSPEPEKLADLDLLLTDAFLLYASHLLSGHVNPESIQAEWFIPARDANLVEILQNAVAEERIVEALERLRPNHPDYVMLKQVLSEYRTIMKCGGWTTVPRGPKMQKGTRGERVAALRSRLLATGDLESETEDDREYFDDVLEQAVLRFQGRHGLKVDGIVGNATLAALNVPVQARICQTKVNLERWRWLPHDFGQRYVLVNIASFGLEVVEHQQAVMKMRVVVGKRARRTPVFAGTMTYMEFNPYWNIPQTIARQDILPSIRKDPAYIAKANIRVFEGWHSGAQEIKPESVDWSQITEGNLTFKLRQEPGPFNALGRIKFMFPNKFAVYLHDTPARELFEKTKRTFSSGCIRIARPIELAAYLVQDDPKWTAPRIHEAIDSNERLVVRVPEPIAVYILYWTAWLGRDGTVNFREDVYGRDEVLERALKEKPPAS